MRIAFTLFLVFIVSIVYGQHPDTGACMKRKPIDMRVSIKGFASVDKVYAGTSSLAKGFELQTADKRFKITGFRVYFYAKFGDLYWRDIKGARATRENLPILKSLKGDEWMEIDCIGVDTGKQLYKARPFTVLIDAR